MSGFEIFVTGGFSSLVALEAAEIAIGYTLSDKLKDLYKFVTGKAKALEAKAEALKSGK